MATALGIIGCGARTQCIMKHITSNNMGIEVIGITDPSMKSITAFQAMTGTNVRVFGSHEELLADAAIQWVLVGSFNKFHREHAVAALDAGKNVFCEKPLATTLEDCLAIRDAVKRTNRKFVMGFVLRYSSHYRDIKKLIDEGQIGEIMSLEFNETVSFNHGGFIHGDWRRKRELAGTHMLEKCCHDIDLINWLIGSRARRIASFAGLDFFLPRNAHHMTRLGKDKYGRDAYRAFPAVAEISPFNNDKDIIDNQVAIIEYENNARAMFHTNCNAAIPERRMYILGTEGAIRADVLTGQLQLQRIGFGTELQEKSGKALGGHGGADGIVARELSEAMTLGTPMCTTIDDGLAAAVTCFGIDQATDTGSVVDMSQMWSLVDAQGK